MSLLDAFYYSTVTITTTGYGWRSREAYRRGRWRKTLNDHVIICGFGTKGQSAVKTLRDKGCKRSEIVVIDERPDARANATSLGLAAVDGSVASTEALREAEVERAHRERRRGAGRRSGGISAQPRGGTRG